MSPATSTSSLAVSPAHEALDIRTSSSTAAAVFGAVFITDDDCRDGLVPMLVLAQTLSPSEANELIAVLLAAGRGAGIE